MAGKFFHWLQHLHGFELVLWCIALLFSLLFLLQSVASVIFGDGHDGHDSNLDGDAGHSFFTIRSMIAFFTMFGWAGLAAYHAGLGEMTSTLLAFGAGCGLVWLLWTVMGRAAKLRSSGTLQLKNALYKVGETYLRIPASRGGTGKIQLHVQGRYLELDAMTDDPADIATGRPIQVVSVLGNHVLLVTSELTS
ncbi:hypothetical protein [Flaviaesturariibacter terrae]